MKKLLICFIMLMLMSSVSSAQNLTFTVDNITVGTCQLKVYVAKSFQQKSDGMLGFNEKTFIKDGMLFLGDSKKNHYYHTVGMLIPIRIMGVNKVGDKAYAVNGDAKYAPIGLDEVKIFGESVFEVPEYRYNSLKECLYK